MSKLKLFTKNFLVLFTGNSLAQIVPFLFAPFLARIFSPDEFAIYGNYLALASMFAIIAGGRYEFAVVLPKGDKKAINLIVLASGITLIVTILTISLVFFKDLISNIYQNNQLSNYIPYIFIGVSLLAFNGILNQWLIRTKKYRSISASKIIQSFAHNGATILLGTIGYHAKGLIFGWCLGILSSIIILLLSLKKDFHFSWIKKSEIKEVAKEYKDFPLINSLHAFADIFFSQFLLFAIITREFGLVYLGLFFMMNKYLRAPIRLIGSAAGQVYYQEANQQHIQNLPVYPVLKNTIKVVAMFAIPIMTIVFFFAPYLFKIYLGSDWIKSGEYAQIMATPILINFLVAPISSTPLIYKKQKKALIISFFGYTGSIVSLYLGIWMGWGFEKTLILFSGAMTCYYLYLLFWYISLTRSK